MDDKLDDLIGKTIKHIYMDSDVLTFETNLGTFSYGVEGDCCSSSYFYDFYGVDKLLQNGPVVSVNQVDLEEPDDEDARSGDVVIAYGFQIVTEDPKLGEVTSAFSFRNDSNGYYGGWLFKMDRDIAWNKKDELKKDTQGIDWR